MIASGEKVMRNRRFGVHGTSRGKGVVNPWGRNPFTHEMFPTVAAAERDTRNWLERFLLGQEVVEVRIREGKPRGFETRAINITGLKREVWYRIRRDAIIGDAIAGDTLERIGRYGSALAGIKEEPLLALSERQKIFRLRCLVSLIDWLRSSPESSNGDPDALSRSIRPPHPVIALATEIASSLPEQLAAAAK